MRDGRIRVASGRISSIARRELASDGLDRCRVGWVALGHFFAYRLLYATLARRLLMGIVTLSDPSDPGSDPDAGYGARFGLFAILLDKQR